MSRTGMKRLQPKRGHKHRKTPRASKATLGAAAAATGITIGAAVVRRRQRTPEQESADQ